MFFPRCTEGEGSCWRSVFSHIASHLSPASDTNKKQAVVLAELYLSQFLALVVGSGLFMFYHGTWLFSEDLWPTPLFLQISPSKGGDCSGVFGCDNFASFPPSWPWSL